MLTKDEIYILRLLEDESQIYQAPRAGKFNDNAHPPIHPAKLPKAEDELNPTEQKVFNFILTHFLA